MFFLLSLVGFFSNSKLITFSFVNQRLKCKYHNIRTDSIYLKSKLKKKNSFEKETLIHTLKMYLFILTWNIVPTPVNYRNSSNDFYTFLNL